MVSPPLAARPRTWQGPLFILASAAAFGFMAYFRHLAPGVSVEALLMLRFGIGGAVLALLAVVLRQPWPRGRALLMLIFMGAVGYFGEAWFYFSALDDAPSGIVSLLLYTYPAFVTVLSIAVLGQRPGRVRLIALCLAVAGTALMAVPGIIAGEGAQHVGVRGIIYGLACAATYAVYIIVGARVVAGGGAIAASAIVALSASATFAGVLAARYGVNVEVWGEALPHGPVPWLAVAGLALICTVIGVAGFLAGLARVGPVEASTLAAFEPVVTVAVGVLLLGDSLSPLQCIGGLIIVAAAIMTARAAPPPPRRPAGGADATS